MEKFYEKLKAMPEKKFLTMQKILGAIAGVICWLALRAGNFSEDQLISYLFLALFLAVILGVRTLSKKIERPLVKFQMFLAIGLGVALVIFALFTFVLSPYVFHLPERMGLLELIFGISV